MRYLIKTVYDYFRDYSYYGGNLSGDIREKSTCENSTDSLEVFKEMIKDFVDPLSYEPTIDNIKKEFPEANDTGIKSIVNYYSVRTRIFKEIMRWIDENKDSIEPVYFHFEFPENTNWFSIDGINNGEEKQNEASIYIEIRN